MTDYSGAGAFLRRIASGDEYLGYSHWCPGCRERHVFWVKHPRNHQWGFDGNFERPSFTPSMRVYKPKDDVAGTPEITRCHYFLTGGVINFLADSSTHLLRGSVPLPRNDQAEW